MKRSIIWLLVADGAHARFFQLSESPRHLTEIPELTMEGSTSLTQEITSDRPGRSSGDRGGIRHALEPRTDAHVHLEAVFAAKVAKTLEKAAKEYAVDKVLLVAPPRALGELRKQMGPLSQRLVTLEIAGEWVKESTHDISHRLAPYLAHATILLHGAGGNP
jgi:protein required for attachment to host cells